MKKINLELEKTISRIAGFEYGQSIYNEQVKSIVDSYEYSKDIELTITFPDFIENIASSFVQGFFSQLIPLIGYDGIEKNIHIQTSSEWLTKSIYDNLY